MDINPETSGKMVTIHPIEAFKQIILVTTNGMIIYLYLNEPNTEKDCEFKYFIKELGIECYSSLLIASRSDNRIFDLWLGSSNSEVFIYSLKYMNITNSYLHTSSHHYVTNSNIVSSPFDKNNQFNFSLETVSETKELNVVLMKVTQMDAFFLWSYVFPGSTIYLWNYVSKKIMSAYNCKKSFEDGDKSIDRRDFRVVDIEFLNSYLFCAINNGAVLVLKRLTLTPIQVFTSHVHQLYKLCSVQFETRMNIWSKHNKQNMTSQVKKTQNMLLSMGRALAPIHEDIYLSNRKYRTDALQNYANCLILNAWNCNHD